ncbi:MAG: replication-relaxation family protein [Streptococcaceae bacterium]|jgi:hypothetical protein|nr:replication-relaxation family protein [Streptococcaceae bacterium]
MQEIASITDTWKNVFSLCSASDFLSTKSLNDIRKSTVLKDSNFTKQSIERYIQIQKLFKRVEITDPFKTNIYSMTKKGYKELSLTISKNYSGKINTHDLKTRMVYFSALRESCFMLDESLTKRDFHLVFPKRMMPIKTSDIALKRKLEKEREEKYKIFETLVPDAVHEENGVNVCLEFDNLTERNPQLLNKIGRYIAYAGKHLDKEFRVVFVFADYSYKKRSPQKKVKIA